MIDQLFEFQFALSVLFQNMNEIPCYSIEIDSFLLLIVLVESSFAHVMHNVNTNFLRVMFRNHTFLLQFQIKLESLKSTFCPAWKKEDDSGFQYDTHIQLIIYNTYELFFS